MIISASRRTDIPAAYSEWFFNRIKEGFAVVRNPVNHRQISRVSLSPDVVDCIVFWTKYPEPMIERLGELKDYNYYFQFTLTPYGADIESKIPPKSERISSFLKLAERIGKERVVWRYDPIIMSEEMDAEWHIKNFEELAEALAGKTERCVISFLDDYYRVPGEALGRLGLRAPTKEEEKVLARSFSEIAKRYGFELRSCCEGDLEEEGVLHGSCIDAELIQRIAGAGMEIPKDKNQRENCLCAQSIDIGAYDTCPCGCVYCYANHGEILVKQNAAAHDANSPIICGSIPDIAKIPEKEAVSFITGQIMF